MPLPDNLELFEESPDHQSPLVPQSNYYHLHNPIVLPQDHINSLKIFNNNARSLLSSHSHYETLFSLLENANNLSFDIITFTETWLDETLCEFTHFEKYKHIFKHKIPDKRGGGIDIYIKDHIKYKLRPDLAFPTDKSHMFDCIFVELVPASNTQCNLILGVLYRSPSYNNISEFTDNLISLIDCVNKEKKTDGTYGRSQY